MDPNDYNNLCNSIYEEIYRRLERKDDERLRFARRGTAEVILNDSYLRRFLRSLAVPNASVSGGLGVSEDDFIARIHERKLHTFLAILIFATCRVEAARTFVTRLVTPERWTDDLQASSRLPASRETLIALFGDVVAADKFFTMQGCFCAVVLRKGEEVCISEVSTIRLPFLQEQPLSGGAFGKVFRVVVAKGHFIDPNPAVAGSEYNDHELVMVRKDYNINGSSFPRAGQEEREIMSKILGGSLRGRRCENIVENWGSLEIAPDTYSLFMPLAVCDLRAYMMEHCTFPPVSLKAKAEIIACAAGLANGLAFLHGGVKTQDFEDMICYQMDLKPDNVLVFRENGRYMWKLSDFSMARVKIRNRGPGEYDRERDLNSWFRQRWQQQQPVDPSLSPIVRRRGEGTYQPPESISQARMMTTKSDVWSLGCIVSVISVYLEDGGAGVNEYSITRMSHQDSDNFDRFFVRRRFEPSRLHPDVKKWHKRLVQIASDRDPEEGVALKKMLDGLQEGALQTEQDRRCDADSVRKLLETTCKRYDQLAKRDTTPLAAGIVSSVYSTPRPRPFARLLPRLYRNRTNQTTRLRVDQWRIDSDEDFKGCEISPKGSVVAYWTDTKISLCTSLSLHASGTKFSSEYSLDIARGSIWKSISLTETCLIASTTGTTFNCYIFDLRNGPANEATLCQPQKLVLRRLPEIQKLAISPDSRNLAFVLRHHEDDGGPGSVFFVARGDLTSLIETAETNTVETSALHTGSQPPASTPQLTLDWPAADIVNLSISDTKNIYLVIKSELAAGSWEHGIRIVQVSLQDSTIDILNTEPSRSDSSSAVSFFTTFSPLCITNNTSEETSPPSKPVAALVTGEKRLHIQAFSGSNPSRNLQWDLQNYRVVKLLNGREPDQLFALGTSSANNKILLLELTLAANDKAPVSVREVAHVPELLYRHVFTACLVEANYEGGEQFVLIATLLGNGDRRSIYKIYLTEPEDWSTITLIE